MFSIVLLSFHLILKEVLSFVLAGEQQAGTERSLGNATYSVKATLYKESKFKTLLTALKMFLLDVPMNGLQETQGRISRMPSER